MKGNRKTTSLLLTAVMTGLLAGWLYGNRIVSHLLKGDIGLSTFLFMPSKNVIDTYILLNNSDELKRLVGYYAYRESGGNDLEFLYKRYTLEDSVVIKKTIIWIAERTHNPEEMQVFYKKLYDASTDSLKRYLQVKINSYELIEKSLQ